MPSAFNGEPSEQNSAERARLRNLIEASGSFDASYYAARYDVASQFVSPLDHFLDVGLDAGHQPAADFDPPSYLEANPDVAASGQPAFLHWLTHGRAEGRARTSERARLRTLIEASGLFDPGFYAARYPGLLAHGIDPLDHFIAVGLNKNLRPSLEFDPVRYLENNTDVGDTGFNPLLHYIEHGKPEGRPLPAVRFTKEELASSRERILRSKLFDVDFYLNRNPVVRSEGCDPIVHYLLEGGRSHNEVSTEFSLRAYVLQHRRLIESGGNPLLDYLDGGSADEPLPADASALRNWELGTYRLPFQEEHLERMAVASFFARFGFDFGDAEPHGYLAEAVAELVTCRPSLRIEAAPDVSIVIPAYGQLCYVLNCLKSLSRQTSRYSAEIIVADDVSPERDRTELLATIPWIRYERNASNLGFLLNCNEAAKKAKGRYVVLLNSDTSLVHGWLDELLDTFDTFPNAGFVGSKLLNADGSLQEAGGLYWSDGLAWNYGRGMDALHPRYSYARQVDWVSGASIAVPTELWRAVGGFDEAYRPAYCEDVDLAFRIRERGYEIWYQPLSRVIHFEGVTHGRDETKGIKAHQVTNLRRLQRSWKGRLEGKRAGGCEPDLEANRTITKRMLVIDANMHTPDRDAGSLMGSRMMRVYRELGYHQTFVPLHGFAYGHRYTEDYQRLGVEVIYAPYYNRLSDLLAENREYDYVFIHRYNVANEIIELIRAALPMARIIFLNADLHFLRTSREADLSGDRQLKVRAVRMETEELAVFAKIDCGITHTPDEKQAVESRLPVLRDNLLVFPWISDVDRRTPDFDGRRDVVFVGGFPHTPNVDAMVYFVEEVWPMLAGRLPSDAKLIIVGNAPPAAIRKYESEQIKVTGFVESVEPYLARARVFIAPLRYGAGIKGKLVQSLANGVPSVATNVATEGIGLVDGVHCRTADTAASFADAVADLFENREVWSALREAGYRFVEERYSWASARRLCERSLDIADATWTQREKRKRLMQLRKLLAEQEGHVPFSP